MCLGLLWQFLSVSVNVVFVINRNSVMLPRGSFIQNAVYSMLPWFQWHDDMNVTGKLTVSEVPGLLPQQVSRRWMGGGGRCLWMCFGVSLLRWQKRCSVFSSVYNWWLLPRWWVRGDVEYLMTESVFILVVKCCTGLSASFKRESYPKNWFQLFQKVFSLEN